MSLSWRSVSRWSRRLRQSDETWVGSIHFGGFASVDVSPLHSTDVGVCRKFVYQLGRPVWIGSIVPPITFDTYSTI
jgi:hypothetical protein